ncbi:tRNA 2-thiouridine(34) synthase MnmA [Eubacteriales bacterium OttesenSCG-928-N13]|nr:tRNA 2-thiouridine(34) synthase MnmA [Eubacteriales bacterium OttesenSCG-928-N13]
MSGGVDSSVAALLLKQQGHQVTGVFMNNWEEQDENGACTAEQDWQDVQRVCEIIGIPYYSVNFAQEYRERVFEHFLAEYRLGRTPNPDVLCNREIKFSAFLDFALGLGADKIATGHFAGIDQLDGEYRLLRSADENKDQTYFLYMIGQRALEHAIFPVGNMHKAEIRALAESAGLPTSAKKDSTGVCFIGERDFRAFLAGYLPAQPGEMLSTSGEIMGKHDGLMYYTLGQRRGLGIGGSGDGRRWFVVEKDLSRNQLIVEQGEDSPRLYTTSAIADAPHWVAGHAPAPDGQQIICQARFRHRQPLQDVRVTLDGDQIHIAFDQPQRAITPGQAAVLYQGEACLGGGTIM